MFDTQLAKQNLGKNNTPRQWWPPSHYGRHGAHPRRRRKQQSANMMCNKSILLKLEDIIVFTIN
jgi:hypothetical protein